MLVRSAVATNAELAGRRRSFLFFFPFCVGALVLILALGLAFASAFVEALRERRSLDASDKGPWSQAIRASTSVAATCVSVRPEQCVDRRSVRSGRQVKMRCQCDLLCHARWSSR